MTQAQAELLYRVCEAYANKAISGFEVHRQLRRFQNTMVALMAIEQLTGAVQGPNASLTGSASATTDQRVLQARQALEGARTAQSRAENELDALKGPQAAATERHAQASARVEAADKENNTQEAARLRAERDSAARDRAAIDAQATQRDSRVTSARQATERAEAALASAEAGGTQASANATQTGSSRQGNSSADISDAIKYIVDTIVTGQQTTVELCHDLMSGEFIRQPTPATTNIMSNTQTVIQFCMKYLQDQLEGAFRIDLINAQARLAAARTPTATNARPPSSTSPRQLR